MTIPAEVLDGRREVFRKAQAALEENGAGIPANSPVSAHGANDTNGGLPIKRLSLVCAAEVKMEPVTWVLPGYVPAGKVTGVEGPMGTGKTTIVLQWAADVSASGDVIIISLEDDHADTLVPRLHVAGANLFRCHLFSGYDFGGERIDGPFSIEEDCERLKWEIEERRSPFVMIDPIMAAIGSGVNSYKDQDVRRRVLGPLANVASETGAAIVFIRHFRKQGGTAENAGGGSGGIGNACRSVLRVDKDPEKPDRFLLSSVKSSCSERPPTIAYRIEGVELPTDPPIITSRIIWEGESTWTADALAAHAMGTEERPRADEAIDWLRDALKDGQRQAKELFRNAESDGIPKRTLQRAADVLKVIKERKGFGEGSTWTLPKDSIHAKESSFVPSNSMAPMGTNGTNEPPKRLTRTIEIDGRQVQQELVPLAHGDQWRDLDRGEAWEEEVA